MVMEHGTYSRYTIGRCRCDECRRAKREYEAARTRRQAYGTSLFVDADLARERLAALLALGYSRKEICRLTGIEHKWLHTLEHAHPRTGRPVTRCSRENYERLRHVYGRKLMPGQRVDAEPARAIVRRLHAAGLTVAEMCRVTGLDRQPLDALLHGRREQVEAGTLAALLRNLDELRARAPRDIRKWRS